jgi:hypothetical protein
VLNDCSVRLLGIGADDFLARFATVAIEVLIERHRRSLMSNNKLIFGRKP